MLLVLRALLVVCLAMLPTAAAAAARCQQRARAANGKLGNSTGPKGKTIKLILDPSVQPLMASRSASPIANLSLTPWTYIEDCVESRFPMKIYHAQCLTSGCLSQQGGREDVALEAKPIYYQVLVLRRQKKKKKGKNKYDFTLGTEVIPVGCTCVRPKVIPQE